MFELTAEKCELLKRRLSSERLSPYLLQSDNDLQLALRLYSWNTSISESFYGLIQGYEIVLRNISHEYLSSGLGKENWWASATLRDNERNDILDAEDTIKTRGVPVTVGRIIAELNLSFWTNLYSNFYEQQFWIKHLRKPFPPKMDRKIVHKRFESIKVLRNRLAHHETLITRDIQRDHAELLEAISWISPSFKAWLSDGDSFVTRFANRPMKTLPHENLDHE